MRPGRLMMGQAWTGREAADAFLEYGQELSGKRAVVLKTDKAIGTQLPCQLDLFSRRRRVFQKIDADAGIDRQAVLHQPGLFLQIVGEFLGR